METVNRHLFLMINAGESLTGPRLTIATLVADYAVLLVPLTLVLLWFHDRTEAARIRLLLAFCAAILALGLNQMIGLVYFHPRPFMEGIGHAYLPHAADSSFPSDHMTVFCAVGLALAIDRATRRTGTLLLLTALPVAWSRIYLGVHFPFDMTGGLGTAAISVAAVRLASRPLENLACRPLLRLYGTMGHTRRHGGK